ncbi:MAG: cytochrome c3 family protein [Flavobacteriaceae bacterium]
MSWTALSRQQRLDACAQCHSGLRQELLKGTPFFFMVGDNLKEYAQNHNSATVDNSKLDVHANQYGLLISSECFKQTATMDCTTCHDPHKNQRGNAEFFNQKCMECHNTKAVICKAETSQLNQMGNNCIACHMPAMPSKSMTIGLDEDGQETPFYVRTHLIDVYSEELWRTQ